MSTDSQVPSGEPVQEPSGQQAGDVNPNPSPGGTPDNKTVQYDTYAKTLAQEKSLRERVKALEAEKAEVERQKLEAEGKTQELLENYKQENEKLKEEKRASEAEKANAKINSQVVAKAAELGCVDLDLIKDLVSHSSLDIDQSYKVGDDSLTLALDRLKRQKPYLFQGKKPAVVDAPPASTQAGVTSANGIPQSVEDMEKLYRQKFGGAQR